MATPKQRPESSDPTPLESILLVERDILVRQPLAEYLRGCGYKVLEAANPAEARQIIEHAELPVDIILADANADTDGGVMGFTAWARNHLADVQVILAGTVTKVIDKAQNVCEEGPVITMPYEHKLVLERIRRALATRTRKQA